MKTLIKIIGICLFLIWVSGLASCTPKYHIKRYNHHKGKLIEAGVDLASDTTFIDVPVKIEGFKANTGFSLKNGPVKFEKRNLVLDFIPFPEHDSVYVKVLQMDTVIKFKERVIREGYPVYVESECNFWKIFKWWQWLLIGLGLVALSLLFSFFRR